MVGEGYLLRRNDFQEVVVGWHAGLLEDTSLADVMLVCGSTFLPAHRVVLAASSKVFRDMLVSATLHPHPIVYLHGIAPSIMLDILKFIHLGKVEVDAATFDSFLAAAMELQVEGLHVTAEEVEGQENKEVEAVPETNEEKERNVATIDESISPKVKVQKPENSVKKYQCDICHEALCSSWALKRHKTNVHKILCTDGAPDEKRVVMETPEDGNGSRQVEEALKTPSGKKYLCNICSATVSSSWALKRHKTNVHKNVDISETSEKPAAMETAAKEGEEENKEMLETKDEEGVEMREMEQDVNHAANSSPHHPTTPSPDPTSSPHEEH